MTLPIHRFLNYIYWWYSQRVERIEDLDYQLAQPLPGETPRVKAPSQADLASEGAEFMAFMSQARSR
jgi:hypothetical protein